MPNTGAGLAQTLVWDDRSRSEITELCFPLQALNLPGLAVAAVTVRPTLGILLSPAGILTVPKLPGRRNDAVADWENLRNFWAERGVRRLSDFQEKAPKELMESRGSEQRREAGRSSAWRRMTSWKDTRVAGAPSAGVPQTRFAHWGSSTFGCAGEAVSIQRFAVRNPARGTVVAHNVCLADTPRARRVGLLKQAKLEPGEGLWIYPSQAIHTFWMRFPIDVAFLDRNLRVKRVYHRIPPFRLTRLVWGARSVLELASGVLASTRTETGDQLQFIPQEDQTCLNGADGTGCRR